MLHLSNHTPWAPEDIVNVTRIRTMPNAALKSFTTTTMAAIKRLNASWATTRISIAI